MLAWLSPATKPVMQISRFTGLASMAFTRTRVALENRLTGRKRSSSDDKPSTWMTTSIPSSAASMLCLFSASPRIFSKRGWDISLSATERENART